MRQRRPWRCYVDDEPLRNRRGAIRKFATKEAAIRAAWKMLEG